MTRLKADLLLASATIFWGSTFIISKILLKSITLFDYMTVRFIAATILMLLVCLVRKERFTRRSAVAGIITGIVLYGVYMFQTGGLIITSASNTGFITGTYVIFVPLLSFLFYRKLPNLNAFLGILLALAGLYFISGGDFTHFNKGDILVLVNALLVGLHILLTYHFSQKNSPYTFTAVMFATVAFISTMVSLFKGVTPAAFELKYFLVLMYLAVFCTVYSFTIQSVTQRFTTANRTALILTLEPLFAAIFAVLIGGETLKTFTIIGGVLIAGAIVISQLNDQKT